MGVAREYQERNIFNNIHAVVLLVNPDTADIVDANSAALDFYGYSLETITRMKITDINILTKEQVFDEMRMAKTEQRTHFIFRHRLANGEIRDVEVYSSPVVMEDKKVLFSIIHDITKRIQAEEALKRSEERLRMINDATFEGIAISERGIVIDANQQFAKMFGYSVSEITGMNLSDIVAPEHRDLVARHIKEDYQEAYEFIGLKKAGSRIYVEARGKEINYQGRQAREAVIRDITERKKSEKSLQQSEERLRTLIHSIRTGVIVHAADTSIVQSNAMAQKLLGLTEDQMLGKKVIDPRWKFIREDGSNMPLEEYPVNQVIATQNILENIVVGVYHPEMDDVLWTLFNAVPEFDQKSDLVRVIVTFVDITERKKTEKALQKSEERFRNLVETTSDWIWEVDENAVYTYVSPNIRNMLGYEPEDFVGKTPFDIMPPEEAKRVAEIFNPIAASQKPFKELENANLHKNGHQVLFESSGIPFFDAEGTLCGYRGIDRDITERKHVEEEREKLIHELKDALAKVKTLSGMIPICCSCQKIRDDKGYWKMVADYMSEHSEAEFSHGYCPECFENYKKTYPEYFKKKDN